MMAEKNSAQENPVELIITKMLLDLESLPEFDMRTRDSIKSLAARGTLTITAEVVKAIGESGGDKT